MTRNVTLKARDGVDEHRREKAQRHLSRHGDERIDERIFKDDEKRLIAQHRLIVLQARQSSFEHTDPRSQRRKLIYEELYDRIDRKERENDDPRHAAAPRTGLYFCRNAASWPSLPCGIRSPRRQTRRGMIKLLRNTKDYAKFIGKQAVDRDRQRVERFLHVRAVDEDFRSWRS